MHTNLDSQSDKIRKLVSIHQFACVCIFVFKAILEGALYLLKSAFMY